MSARWERPRDCTIPAVLDRLVTHCPDREALVYPRRGLRLSFQDLDDQTLTIARAFRSHGVAQGDRVTVWAENVPEWILVQLALARIGAILVTANTALKTPEIEYLLGQSETSVICFTAGPDTHPYPQALQRVRPRLPELRLEIFLGDAAEAPALPWSRFLARAADTPAEEVLAIAATLAPDDVINMQYTSGTTGFPKGVMLTHKNLVNNAHCLGESISFQPAERLALTVPLFHCFGCVVGTLGAYVSAATICALDHFQPAAVLELIEGEACNVIYGVPTHFRLLLEEQEARPRNLTSMRTGIMGGAPCPEELVRRIVTDLHVPQMVAAYGLTECSPGVSINDPQDSIERRSQTVGRPLDEIQVRIMDPDTLQETPHGAKGELWVRGHCVMRGYYKKPVETAEVLRDDGWLRTGDLAVLGQDGYLRIVGRIKEMVIKGGENVYPAEVEDTLRRHPAVRDAAVFGVPDDKWGEELHAAILLHEGQTVTEAAVQEFARDRLAGVKVPVRVHVVGEFPMTASGKVQKFRLAEQFGPSAA